MIEMSYVTWLLATAQGALVGVVVLLVLMIGASVLVGLGKLRHRGRAGARSMDEVVGANVGLQFLPRDAPNGPIDQLRAGISAGRQP